MRRRLAFVLSALAYAAPGLAQYAPPGADAHIRQVDYRAEQVVPVTITPGYELSISLAPDEVIQTVALGNTSAFQVATSHKGTALFVKALQPGASTNMTVLTDVRQYVFTLDAADAGTAPAYAIVFRYPRPATISVAPPVMVASYKLHGSRSLWPTRISDDGVHVFIDWPPNIDIPAVYALDAQGRESLTNGMMRGDHVVIDAIAPRLVFRLDQEVAIANRTLPKVPKK